MPHPYIDAGTPPSSDLSGDSPSFPPQEHSQFSKSKHFSPPNGASRPENFPDDGPKQPAERLSLDSVEPFPPGLFRVPVPDAVFSQMPEMGGVALRCLLGLIHLSFRFDPEEGSWICPEDFFSRSDVERATGLSDEGTRNGLAQLEEIGWVEVGRSGRSHRYKLLLEVPDRRFTYVPTALLEELSSFDSTTALRVVLAVLRRTWGWTQEAAGENASEGPQDGEGSQDGGQLVHDRWAKLSNRELAEATGRSETAVKTAAQALQGDWIERVRPGNRAYQYRFLPERVGDGSGDSSSFCGESPNKLPPDRQKSDPPTTNRESSFRDKQPSEKTQNEETPGEQGRSDPTDAEDAVSGEPPDGKTQTEEPGFSEFSGRKETLGQKLVNAGVWPNRARECLRRYSARRIEANFELWRKRAPEVEDDGAFLCAAITDGYADLSGPKGSPQDRAEEASAPRHKQKVSAEEKEALVRRCQGVKEKHFHRFRCAQGPSEKQFLYLNPEAGGPSRKAPRETPRARRTPATQK